MTSDIIKTLPMRQGHFLLESGYHSDLWFDLDALFLSPHDLTPTVAALAELLRPYDITAVCGPLLGGAFLALALAEQMKLRFYFTQKTTQQNEEGFFKAKYVLPSAMKNRVRNEHIAIVDDVISAGSSVRATMAALHEAGASPAVVGTLLLLGKHAAEHFSANKIPLVTLIKHDFNFWAPEACPLCRAGAPLENPASPILT